MKLSYVKKAEILESDIKDFRNKTLVLWLNKPMQVVSTLEGQRHGITTVANHYFPPPSWGLGHNQGLEGLKTTTQKARHHQYPTADQYAGVQEAVHKQNGGWPGALCFSGLRIEKSTWVI